MTIDPLHQFMVSVLIPLRFGGVDVSLTNSGACMVGVSLFIVAFLAFSLRAQRIMPKTLQTLGESGLSFLQGVISESNGPHGLAFLPFVVSIFFFVLMGNLLGMIPFSFTFTSQFVVNFALAVMVIGIITLYGIVHLRGAFFRVFFAKGVPWWVAPILIPVEVISYASRPISLAVRLFANMVAGHSMLKIFAYFTVGSGIFGVGPFFINMALVAFEFLVAFLQAYVFAMLCCVYLNDALHAHV